MPTTNSLQELLISAHFEASSAFSAADIADWAGFFSGDFPLVQQAPALPRIDMPASAERFVLAGMPAANDAFQPRTILRSANERYSIQLQSDRLVLGWHRTEMLGEPAEYDGFAARRAYWAGVLGHHGDWAQARFQRRPSYRLVEIFFSNAVPLEAGGTKRRLSEIFTLVQPRQRPVAAFTTSWVESVYPPIADQPPKGLVSTRIALGSTPYGRMVVSFTFSGIGAISPGEESARILDDVHARIREIYSSSIAASA